MPCENLLEESCLFGDGGLFVEEMYDKYRKGEADLPQGWKEVFLEAELSRGHKVISPNGDQAEQVSCEKQGVLDFFRSYGHLAADLDPLGMTPSKELDYERYISGLDFNDKESMWRKLGYSFPVLVEKLKSIYCGKVGFEYMHILSHDERIWLQRSIENTPLKLSAEERKEILFCLQETELFEQFLHVKYPGYKRFSVEGGDATVPAIEKMIGFSSLAGVEEVILGMAHRGRLSVLTKVMRKPYAAVLYEFAGGVAYPEGLDVSGDVKYHLGYSCNRETSKGVVHVSMAYNPSHLESVNPVVMGRVKAKADMGKSAMGILIHGDASFIGQGVVSECLTIGGVEGYDTGGIVHFIINNQIGFTADPESARTSLYCSDVAKMIDAPIFHVNGDDPDAVIAVTKLAVEYRCKFKKDVVIDMVCYRRFGHNEGDEPMFTQPLMYSNIAGHDTVAKQYASTLIAEGVVSSEEVEEQRAGFSKMLENAFTESATYKPQKADWFEGAWKGLSRPIPGDFASYVCDTGVKREKLLDLMRALSTLPEGFAVNKKIARLLDSRLVSVDNGNIDWGTGETLAYASLLAEGHAVRLSGEDCGRGTFSHRHVRLIDQNSGEKYVPLNALGVPQGRFEVMNSPLSEYAVMGFEYGYSLDAPNALTIWEAQFGDFANGAQIIVDQFITSAETKWLRSSGLVLLLPHGYEGQGPEHSSARIERYLQLCAEDNVQVVNCTTPANFFHVLRRQIHRDFRKPLIVFTPKSLLRHKMAVSKLADFEKGGFLPVLGDTLANSNGVKKVVISSGKVYYDLLESRGTRSDIALLRLEQYYPFPSAILADELRKYKGLEEVIWCQEEPANQGGWSFVRHRIEDSMRDAGIAGSISYVGRRESASTAAGYAKHHALQQQEILDSVFC